MEIDRNGLEVLDREECFRLLRTAAVGRVAITSGALPVVLPVNFCLHGDTILFRTGRGTKLDAATRNAVVAFEVDQISPTLQAGWSVLVTGLAREVTDPEELAVVSALPLTRWAPHNDGRYVAVSSEIVSGRRIVPDIVEMPRLALTR